MKKVLIGCGVIFILLVALVAGSGIWIARTATQVKSEMGSATNELAATNRAFPFNAPADGQLTEPQLTAWLKVREKLVALDRQRAARIKNPLEAMRAMANMPETIKEYTQELRQARMSAAEYAWISSQVMGALKSRAAAKDPQTEELATLIDQTDPALRRTGNSRGFRGGMRIERPQYAPLAVEDARPVLDLLLNHEAEFRKVAFLTFADGAVRGAGRRSRAARAADTTTTATAEQAAPATEEKDTPSTSTAEQSPASAWDQAEWTTTTRQG